MIDAIIEGYQCWIGGMCRWWHYPVCGVDDGNTWLSESENLTATRTPSVQLSIGYMYDLRGTLLEFVMPG